MLGELIDSVTLYQDVAQLSHFLSYCDGRNRFALTPNLKASYFLERGLLFNLVTATQAAWMIFLLMHLLPIWEIVSFTPSRPAWNIRL